MKFWQQSWTRSPALACAVALVLTVGQEAAAQELTDEATGERDAAAEAQAEEEAALADVIRVIQQRRMLRAGRAELQTMFGFGVTDTMFQHMAPVGNLRVHIDENWSIGASGAYYFPDTHNAGLALTTTSQIFDDVTSTFELFPEKSIIEWSAGLDVGFIPVEGKFAIFNQHILYIDFYLLAGGGVVQTSRSPDLKPAGMLGIGAHLYFNRWLALVGEFRDQLYVETFNAGNRVMNHVMFHLGLSIWIPFDFDYRFAR